MKLADQELVDKEINITKRGAKMEITVTGYTPSVVIVLTSGIVECNFCSMSDQILRPFSLPASTYPTDAMVC